MKTKLLFIILFLTTIIMYGQEIDVKVAGTSYASGSTYTYADSQVMANNAAIAFRIENLSAPNLLLSGTPRVLLDGLNADQFLITTQPAGSIANGGASNCNIAFRPTSLGLKTAKITIINNDSDEGTYEIILNGTSTVSKVSSIILTPSPAFTYIPTIAYQDYQADNITSPTNGFRLMSYTLRDGSPTDVDNLPTVLTDITFTLTNWTNLRSIALYDGASEIGIDQEITGGIITFNGLNIIAPDGSTKQFDVLVSFRENVVDNQIVTIKITAAETDENGSSFTALDAGGLTSSGANNKIIVVASRLSFIQQPSDSDTFEIMSPSVTVEAVDGLGSRDLNYTTAVVLSSTGTFHASGTAPLNIPSIAPVQGLATFVQVVHETVGTGLKLTASSGTLASTVSNLFNIDIASAATNYFRSAGSGKWSELTSWESSGNNTTWTAATLVPTETSRSITIRSGHIITCDSNEVADQLTVSAGGTLKIAAGGTLTLKRVSGNDLAVIGTLEYAGGTLDRTTNSAVINIGNGGKYIHSIPSATLTLPTIVWANGSTCSITGLNNVTPITASNMGQTFRTLIWENPNQQAFVNINDDLFTVTTKLTIETSAANKLRFASSGVHNNTIATLEIKGGELEGYSGSASGTLKIASTLITNGKFTFTTSSASSILNNTSTFTINNSGQFIFANGAGSNTFNAGNYIIVNNSGQFTFANNSGANTLNTVAYIRLTSSGKFTFNNSSSASTLNVGSYIRLDTDSQFTFNNSANTNTLTTVTYLQTNNNSKFICSNGSGSSTLTLGTDLLLNNASSLILENTSSIPGSTNITVNRNLTSSSTAAKAIDFGVGDVTGNTIYVKGNFSKSGTGIFTTSSTTSAPTGFVFNGATQGFAYTSTDSAGVNFTVNTTGVFTLNNNYVFNAVTTLPQTVFTVNSGTLNLQGFTFRGNATKARFNIATGVTVETTHGSGLGGTSVTGSFNNFGSIGNTPADGRVSFGANVNYKFNATTTTTPFPVPQASWPTPNNITIGGLTGITTINYTTPFTLNGILSIETGKTLRLNPTVGAHLNIKNATIINGIFDTNGENQILSAGGTPTVLLNGTFITKDAQGFNGTNASIPTIPINMGADAIVNYSGASQIITSFTNYKNLLISGSGTKTLGNSIITLDKTLELTSSILNIEANKTLSVADKITTVDLGIEVQNNGSLVQVTAVDNATSNANTGNIKVIRITKPMYRYDFTYWSSPITTAAAFKLSNLSPVTLFDKYFKWNHAASSQSWTAINYGTEVMVPGRGYSVRAPQPYPVEGTTGAVAGLYTANFVGIPNNGKVEHAITGSTTSDKWNLLGNPYPSAIDATAFINGNSTTLGGTLYFWTHNTSPSNGGSGSYYTYNSADYASWNGTGSTATSAEPGDNGNFNVPSGKIASGQSFFIKGIANGAGTAEFNNSMRVTNNNNQFFKNSTADEDNKHRIWLNLKGQTKGFSQILVGYIENATNNYDIRFDGESFGGNQVTFYSLLENKNLVIQGRALPFNVQDEVPLGYSTTLTGNLTIAIDHTDGLLVNQAVYLKDNLLNVSHNLKESPYSFAATPGTNNTRFVLRYQTEEALANPNFDQQINGVTIRKNNAEIIVNSVYEPIQMVSIYDITGRLIFQKNNCNSNHFVTTEVVANQQTLIVRVQLNNGAIVTNKVW